MKDQKYPAHSLRCDRERLTIGAGDHKFGRSKVIVTQRMGDLEPRFTYLRKNAAFEEWRQKLSPGDRLPRGKFFKGKCPGRAPFVMDELWQALS